MLSSSPGRTKTGYWWQGETHVLVPLQPWLTLAPTTKITACKNVWSSFRRTASTDLGLNPYHTCMLDGHGHNNPDYLPQSFFSMPKAVSARCHRWLWRWSHIAVQSTSTKRWHASKLALGRTMDPHGAWFLLATVAQFNFLAQRKEQ